MYTIKYNDILRLSDYLCNYILLASQCMDTKGTIKINELIFFFNIDLTTHAFAESAYLKVHQINNTIV